MNFDSSVLQVAIEDIIPNRYQPRTVFDDASLDELAQSIKEYGIIQPLVLRRLGDKYEIVAGERRYRAARKAGLSSVPCVITTLSAEKVAEVAVAENTQRHELSVVEEAKSYQALLDQGYMSKEQLAVKMSISLDALESKLKLLTLDEQVQNAVLNNKISDKHAKALLVVPTKTSQVDWLNRIISERLSVKELKDELRKEYGHVTDINAIKQYAMDIPIVTVDPNEIAGTSKPISFADSTPINLGEQKKESFFNNLEEEAANMNMNETINPFEQIFNKTPLQEAKPLSTPTAPIIQPNGEIDSLDTLDFEPSEVPVASQNATNPKDYTLISNRINSIVAELLNESYQVVAQTSETIEEIVFTIKVKK